MAHVPLLLFLSICKPPADSYKYTATTTLSERAKIVIKHMNTGIIKAGKKTAWRNYMNAPLLDQSSPEQVYSSKQCGKIWITDSACDTNNNQTSLFCAIKHRCTLDVPLTKLVVIFSTISNITDPECTDESPQALLAAIYSDTAGNKLLIINESTVDVYTVFAVSFLQKSWRKKRLSSTTFLPAAI